MEIKNILVVGGGMMGKNIAWVLSAGDYAITVHDVREVDIRAGIRESTAALMARGVLTGGELEARLAKISFTTDMDSPAVTGADLVIECVFEDMDLKRETFA